MGRSREFAMPPTPHRHSTGAETERPLRLALAGLAALGAILGFGLGLPPAATMLAALTPVALLAALRGKQAGPAPLRDPVSGCALRGVALQALSQALAGPTLTGRETACIVLGLDAAADLVDVHGQAAHDRLLHAIGKRLSSTLREGDTVTRLEGARFAVVLKPMRRLDLEAAIQISARLQAAVSDPVDIDGLKVYATASAGFALPARVPGRDGAAILAAAELAQEEARRNGPGALRAYSADIARAAANRSDCRDRIEQALDEGEIVAWFQSQISSETGAVTGLEALAR